MPIDFRGLGQAMQGAQQLKAAVSSGRVAVNEAGAKAILAALDELEMGLNDRRRDVDIIKRATKLGASPDAKVMIAYNQQVADGDHQSLVPALEQYKQLLVEVRAAIQEAQNNYRAVDDAARQSFNGQ